MPPLDEGTVLYMPTTMPGISVVQAQELLQMTDGILRRFPEVNSVLGKAGRYLILQRIRRPCQCSRQ